jgi:hypothetical protein
MMTKTPPSQRDLSHYGGDGEDVSILGLCFVVEVYVGRGRTQYMG